MRADKLCLRAVMRAVEGRPVWTGEYACSVCGRRFLPDSRDPAKLLREFEIHRREHTPAASS